VMQGSFGPWYIEPQINKHEVRAVLHPQTKEVFEELCRVEMGVGEVVGANLLGECANTRPILPQSCLLEIDRLETAGLQVGVWFTELSFNAGTLPGAIVERDLNIKVRRHLEMGVHDIWNLKVNAPYRSRGKAARCQERMERWH